MQRTHIQFTSPHFSSQQLTTTQLHSAYHISLYFTLFHLKLSRQFNPTKLIPPLPRHQTSSSGANQPVFLHTQMAAT